MLDDLWSFFKEYWDVLFLVLTWAGIVTIGLKRRRTWKRKRFVNEVNFSLNYVEKGTLRLRTLIEERPDRVWLNEHGVNLVFRAAAATTLSDPFLRFRHRADTEQIVRGVTNVLSQRFADAFVARATGAPAQLDSFIFGVTWERHGGIRSQKLRVILMRGADLRRLCAEDASTIPELRFEHEAHGDRLTTLRRLWRCFASDVERARRAIGEVELGVASAALVEPRLP